MREQIRDEQVERQILMLRGQKVILDTDLARIYGVPTKRLNEQVKRNRHRFPDDFAFQLTAEEFGNLKSQLAISNAPDTDSTGSLENWSQIATSSRRSQFVTTSSRHRGAAYRPWVFTEHGVIMAANVLNSHRAVQMSVIVVRAFVRLRELLATNSRLAQKLSELERKFEGHDQAIHNLFETIRQLLKIPESKPRRIGFQARR